MNDLYRFSPLENESDVSVVWEYLVAELEQLSQTLLDEDLPINTLKIFAHYPEEYDFLYKYISSLGPAAPFNSDTSYYATVERQIGGHGIKYLGVRGVDPYRLHVGCGDYEIANFEEIAEKFAGKSDYVRRFREDMVEIWHPDFDVLGYIVPPL